MKKMIVLIDLVEDSFFIASLSIIVLVVLDIIFRSNTSAFRNILSFSCHQQPDRCFILFNYPIALCTRCLGVYAGFVLFYKNKTLLMKSNFINYALPAYLLISLFIEPKLDMAIGRVERFVFGALLSLFIVYFLELSRNVVSRQIQESICMKEV